MINTLHNEPDTVQESGNCSNNHNDNGHLSNTPPPEGSSTTNLWAELQALNDRAAAYLEDGFVDEARRVLLQAAAQLSQCRAVKRQWLQQQRRRAEEEDAHLILQESDSEDEDPVEEEESESGAPAAMAAPQQQQTPLPETAVNPAQDENASMSVESSPASSCGSEEEDSLMMMSDGPESVDPEELPDFYPYPFAFHSPDGPPTNGNVKPEHQQQWLTGPQYKICSMTVLFNLGLCSHLAWDDEPLKTGRLQQALYFYEKAVLLVLEPSSSSSKKDTTTATFGLEDALVQQAGHALVKLTLALAINIAQCRTELVQYEKVPFWSALIQTLVHAQGSAWHDQPTTEIKALTPFLAKHQQRFQQRQGNHHQNRTAVGQNSAQIVPPEISSPAA